MPIVATPQCMFCGKASVVTMTDDELAAYRRERFIQEALPNWTPDQRELLISGTHPECWTRMFGNGEDE